MEGPGASSFQLLLGLGGEDPLNILRVELYGLGDCPGKLYFAAEPLLASE